MGTAAHGSPRRITPHERSSRRAREPAHAHADAQDAAAVHRRRHPRGGIYARTGEVAGEIGGAIWTGFALAAVIAGFPAASYAELVSRYPQAAGAALYIHKAFKAPLLTFVVAFAVMCSGLASAAALATAFGGDYLSEFVDLPTVLVGLVVIAAVSAINFRGIKESASFNVVCTLIEFGG